MTEVDLCERVRDWLERCGFEVYPEVAGWDLIAVRLAPGQLAVRGRDRTVLALEQVGIHAKLRANCDVLAQAMRDDDHRRYPAHPFVAVPRPGQAFVRVARQLGLGVIDSDGRKRRPAWKTRADPAGAVDPVAVAWPQAHGNPQLVLPPIASRVIVAGAPSPRSLSPWRVKALRFLIWARQQESFAASDVAGFGLRPHWAQSWGLLLRYEPRRNKAGRSYNCPVYRLRTEPELLPDAGYKDVAAELLERDPDR